MPWAIDAFVESSQAGTSTVIDRQRGRVDRVRHAVEHLSGVGRDDPASRRAGGHDADPEDEDRHERQRDARQSARGSM